MAAVHNAPHTVLLATPPVPAAAAPLLASYTSAAQPATAHAPAQPAPPSRACGSACTCTTPPTRHAPPPPATHCSMVTPQGWSLVARQSIPCGTFVCTYDGERLTNHQAEARLARYHASHQGHALLVCFMCCAYCLRCAKALCLVVPPYGSHGSSISSCMLRCLDCLPTRLLE